MKNKGKPSGKYAAKKTDPGRKGNYQRSGWPEEQAARGAKSAKQKLGTKVKS